MKSRLLIMLLLALVMWPVKAARQYAGGDISLMPLYESRGASYYDYDGKKIDDVIKWYASQGMNLMRVRLMVRPMAFPGGDADQKSGWRTGWAYDPNCCQDLDYIIPICQRIQAAGMALLLDFHYTDYWADPEHQWTPEDWKNLDENGLSQKLYDYTKESLQRLKNAGVVPEFIQTGNEISFGMLWGPFGTSRSDFNTAEGEGSDNDYRWNRLAKWLTSAGNACREICPNAKIVLHTEQIPNHWNLWNFYRQMRDKSVDYDIIGLSYYPYWHGDVGVADAELTDLEKCFPDKKIWIVEFNHPYGWEADGANQLYDTYPHDWDGQDKMTRAVIDMLDRHPNANGLIWWWPEFNAKDVQYKDGEWTGWYASALFDSNYGIATPATRALAAYAQAETVYFTNLPAGWTSAGIHTWSDGGDSDTRDWPGAPLQLTDKTYQGKPVWQYTTTGENHKYIIVNNRHKDADDNWVSTDQTFDMTFMDGMIYCLNDWRDSDGNGGWKYGVKSMTMSDMNNLDPNNLDGVSVRLIHDSSNRYLTIGAYDDGATKRVMLRSDNCGADQVFTFERVIDGSEASGYNLKVGDNEYICKDSNGYSIWHGKDEGEWRKYKSYVFNIETDGTYLYVKNEDTGGYFAPDKLDDWAEVYCDKKRYNDGGNVNEWSRFRIASAIDKPYVYVTFPSDWTNPVISAFIGNGDNEADAASLTETGYTYDNRKVYKYEFSGDKHKYLLFFDYPWEQNKRAVTREFANGVLYVVSDNPNAEGNQLYSAPYIVNPSFVCDSGASEQLLMFGNINGKENWDGDYDIFRALRKGMSEYTYTFNVHIRQDSWFRFRDNSGNVFGPDGEDVALHSGDNDKYMAQGSSKAFYLAPGSYTIVVEHYDNKYVLAVGDWKTPAMPDDLYVVGSFTDSWTFDDDFRLERQDDGTYSRVFGSGIPAGTFKIAARDWVPQYSAGAVTVPFNHTIRCHEMNQPKDMVMTATTGHKTKVIFDPVNHTIRVEVDDLKDPVSESYENRVYMHFGQSRQTYGNLDEKPKIHLFADNRPDVPSDEEVTGWNTFEMSPALDNDGSYDLWYYTLNDDQKSWAKDATFFFTRKDNGKIEKFTCGRLVDDDDFNWDYKQWMKYIYFADVADNYNNKATQSYLTLPRFRELRHGDKNKLYIVGQGLNRLHPTADWQSTGWDRIISEDIFSADASMGVFYVPNIEKCADLALSNPIVGGDESNVGPNHWGAKFKMSWINPYEGYVNSGRSGGDIEQQRAWATFNLGIIGFGLRRADASSLGYERAKNKTNYEVYCESKKTLPSNNFNQWDWFVDQQYLGGAYTLVVDLHDNCGSVTLLPFQPNPTATRSDVTFEQKWLDDPYGNALTYWGNLDKIDPLKAEVKNGKALYKKYNVATAYVDITAINSQELEAQNYDVEYELYLNGVQRGVYYGKPGKVKITGVPVGDTATLGVRARYTDKGTKFSFHSKYAEAPNQLKIDTPAPTIGNIWKKCYTYCEDRGYDSERFAFGAYAEIPVTGASNLNWYGDFELTPAEYAEGGELSKDGEILYDGHKAHNLMQSGVVSSSLNAFKAPCWDDSFGWDNDWAHHLSANGNWPVYLEKVKVFNSQPSYTDDELKTTVNATVYSIYPFLIDLQAVPEGVSESNNMPAKAPVAYDNSSRYELQLIRTSANTQFSLGRESISGIDAVNAGNLDDGEATYYNLQGIEVKGELLPGVYLRRQGNITTKVVVR